MPDWKNAETIDCEEIGQKLCDEWIAEMKEIYPDKEVYKKDYVCADAEITYQGTTKKEK